jgi:hypothetical protein
MYKKKRHFWKFDRQKMLTKLRKVWPLTFLLFIRSSDPFETIYDCVYVCSRVKSIRWVSQWYSYLGTGVRRSLAATETMICNRSFFACIASSSPTVSTTPKHSRYAQVFRFRRRKRRKIKINVSRCDIRSWYRKNTELHLCLTLSSGDQRWCC